MSRNEEMTKTRHHADVDAEATPDEIRAYFKTRDARKRLEQAKRRLEATESIVRPGASEEVLELVAIARKQVREAEDELRALGGDPR